MRLTEAELADGRRLLKNSKGDNSCWDDDAKLTEFLVNHADALLARPEEIAREAVREFAEAALMSSRVNPINSWDDVPGSVIRQLAAARGAALNEKP